jgi:hypothetical protein
MNSVIGARKKETEKRLDCPFSLNLADPSSRKKKTPLNLLPSQSSALATFMSSQNIHVLSTDKNLRPAVIERSEYIQRALYQAVARNIFF